MFANMTFRKSIIYSFTVHFVVLPMTLFSIKLFKGDPKSYKAIQVAVISNMKDLPTLRKKDANAAVKKALGEYKRRMEDARKKAEKAKKKSKKMVLKKKNTKKKRSSIVDRLRRIQRLKKLRKKTRGTPKGKQGIQGTTVAQASNEGIQNWYIQKMQRRIAANYSVPPVFDGDKASLQTVVLLKLFRDGKIKHIEVMDSSRNKIYDDIVIGAVKYSSPFGQVPDKFRKQFLEVGIGLRFRRADFQ